MTSLSAMTARTQCGVFLAMTMAIAIVSMSPSHTLAAQTPFKAVTTFTVIADMAREVAGDVAIVESITKPGAEIHDYQPTPQDLVRAQDADVILWNGLNLERWFERFFADLQDIPSVRVSDGIDPLPIQQGLQQGKPNPHAWMSTDNALIYIENIRRAFVELDPAHAETYNRNAETYSQRIRSLRADLETMLSTIPAHQRYLVTSEGAFSYLAQDLGLQEIYIWPMNADQQGTPQQVRRVIDAVRDKGIPVVFSESTVSAEPAQRIAQESGARYGGVLYVDSLSQADGPVPTYFDLLRITTQTIAKGFQPTDE